MCIRDRRYTEALDTLAKALDCVNQHHMLYYHPVSYTHLDVYKRQSICFAPELETKPLFFKNPALFSNQVVLFFSDKDEEVVRKTLKDIERRSGRRPEDKKEEKVCLDIDMLLYDNKILKPEDWQRGYIQQSLSAFHSSLFIK